MDTGLNNRNELHTVLNEELFRDVEWLVEANSNERHELWREFHTRHKWEQVGQGFGYTIVELETKVKKALGKTVKSSTKQTLPVCVDFSFAIIDGHKVCFYNTGSRLAHSGYVEAFLITHFQRTHDGYTRWNHVDANNFHNCANYLDTVDQKPRKTKYRVDSADKEYHIFESPFKK